VIVIKLLQRSILKLHNRTAHFERIVRFIVCGGSAAALNLSLAYIGVDLLGFHSDLQQNYVNFITMEISLIYSFFVYRAFVWKDKTSSVSRILLRQLPLYHLSAGAGLLSRTLLFPVLQVLGLHYMVNIVLGILTGAAVNYCLSHRYVFNDPMAEKNL
jgi:dolichol-phosphate mannosyltransferase